MQDKWNRREVVGAGIIASAAMALRRRAGVTSRNRRYASKIE